MHTEVHPPRSSSTQGLICPKCQGSTMRRVARSGFLQRKIYPMFGYYPWECSTCRVEKLFRHRGSRKRHTKPQA